MRAHQRCGGNNESTASFTNPATGDVCAYSMPDSDDVKRVEELKVRVGSEQR